ncbi:MAG: hypothetical protein JXP34_26790 [Planctomycetes bacterium]|nr:hypothetical protein [Planctomycetota bacterium]
MSRYRKIDLRMWADEKFRQLSPIRPSGQSLWIYLLTGPHTTSLPGIFRATEEGLAAELGWTVEAFREAFLEVSRLGMAKADWKAHVVVIPNALKYERPQSPNVVTSWIDQLDNLTECELKVQFLSSLKAFLEGLGEGWARPFRKAFPKGFPKAFGVLSSPHPHPHLEHHPSPQPPSGGPGEDPPSPKRKKAKSRRAPPAPEPENGVMGGTVVATWIDACRAMRSVDPKPTGKDTSAAKRMAPLFDGPDDVRGVLDLFVRDDDPFLRKVGWALWALESRINAYRGSDGWKEIGDDRPSYDQPWEGSGRRGEDPHPRRERGDSDFEGLGDP